MSLSLYVGTLSDYFRAALARTNPPPSRARVRERVEAWQTYIGEGLVQSGHVCSAPTWSESEQPAFKHVLGVRALQALRLMLVHRAEDGDPPSELPADWSEHPVWKRAVDDDFGSTGMDQVLVPELWLPGDFDFTFECPYPDGHEVQAGSVGALARQLDEVGKRRLPMGEAERARRVEALPGESADLHELASFAYLAFDAATREATTRGLPMLLHW